MNKHAKGWKFYQLKKISWKSFWSWKPLINLGK